ncbi:MAG: lipid II flippase MurJ [Halopseudomonas sabulinigri]
MFKRIVSTSIILNLGLLLGRLLGFVREIIIAEGYGASWQADVTVTILTLPDILINILVGGALTAALVPSFTADKLTSRLLAYQVSAAIFLIFSVVAIFLSWQSSFMVHMLAPGYSGQTAAVANSGVSLVVLLLPLFVLTGVTTGLLQSQERFTITSLGTFFFNAVLIVGLWFAIRQDSYNVGFIALVVFAAGVLRYISQLLAVQPGFRPVESLTPWLISGDITRRYWQAMLSGGILFIYPVAARSYASMVGEGGVSIFSYAMRLIELPLLICVSFLGVVLLPKLSEAYSQNREMFSKLVVYGLQAVFGLGTVAVATLFVGRLMYVQLAYGRGLQPEAVHDVTQLVSIGLLCVLFQGAVTFMTAAFNAARKTHIPLVMNLAGGAGLLLVLQVSNDHTLLEIMAALTATYGVLAVVYTLVMGSQFLIANVWKNTHVAHFFGGALVLNLLIAVSHWLLLSIIQEVWLSLLITVLAGCLGLVATAFCHHDLRARFLRVGS